MPIATFETPDGDDVEIDPGDVAKIRAGEDEDTVVVELEDGNAVIVVATPREVAAELGLDPLDVIDAADDDETVESLDDDDYGGDDPED